MGDSATSSAPEPGLQPAQPTDARRAVDALVIVVLLVATLVPFSNRALHVDDPFYVWVAQHIAADPLDFYGFTLNWNGLDEPVHKINKNPPGVSYYLALVGSLFGWRETNYHAAFMLLAIGTAFGVYFIAERVTKYPLLAVLLLVTAPVFLLSATNIMAEMGMLLFYVWGLYFWIRGIREDRVGLLVIAAALAGLSVLTKYYALSTIPLFLAYGLAEKRRVGRWMWPLLVTFAIIGAYEVYTRYLYGQGHLFGSIFYAEESNLRKQPAPIRAIIGLAFAGGCAFPAALYAGFLWPRRAIVAFGTMILAFTVMLASGLLERFFVIEPELAGAELAYAVQLALLSGAGVHLALLAARDVYKRRDATSMLLGLWLAGTFVFAVRFNWAVNGRSLLPAAVPAGLLVARAWEMRDVAPGRFDWRRYALVVPGLCVALLVTYADYRQANVYRIAASLVERNFGGAGHTIWYQGHWGFQYYMEQIGAKHTNTTGIDVAAGDYLVTPFYNTASHDLNSAIVTAHWAINVQPFPWLTTWNPSAGAGYYADAWGPLPFVVTRVREEKFMVVGIGYTGTIRVGGEGGSPVSPAKRE